jgi:hypothetical protein
VTKFEGSGHSNLYSKYKFGALAESLSHLV